MITRNRPFNLEITWTPLPEDYPIPSDPVEDIDHPIVAQALKEALYTFDHLVEDALIVSNFALCAKVNQRTICKGPDWMYVRPVNAWQSVRPRRSYTPHAEGSIPQVVMEFLSETYGDEYSMESSDSIGKWFFYEQVIQVQTYVIFRPYNGYLEVYGLENGRYRLQTPDENERYLIPGLELFLGLWEGSYQERSGYWLRWWTGDGELLLWKAERLEEKESALKQTESALEQEKARSRLLEEQLQSLGIDPSQL